MDKNSVIGWLLIALIFMGFMFYQTKQVEKQQAYLRQQDSLAQVELAARMAADSAYRASLPDSLRRGGDTLSAPKGAPAPIYKDSLLERASKGEGEIITIENSLLALEINTKGAQPWSARVKDYKNYDSSDLYIFKRGGSEMGYSIYAGQNINTKDFIFQVESKTDTSVVLALPIGGGAIRQRYSLREDQYMVDNVLSFDNLDGVIPRNVSSIDLDWNATIPRMEKGYKNESQYSKLDYYFDGDRKISEIGRGRNGSKRVDRISWFAFQQQFFSAIMHPVTPYNSGSLSVQFLPENNPEHNLMACSASLRADYKSAPEVKFVNEFYFGPNGYRLLKSYDQKFEKIVPLGGWLVAWITRFVIIPLFDFLHKFISNYGIIILLMTIFIKLVVLPFAYKSLSSSAKMQAIKPEIDKLNEKYPKPEDAMKKQQATMELYNRAGISPMGGCLPMLLQFPILWAMFRFFPASIELRQQKFLWAEDLSAYDSIVDFGGRVPLLGDHISLFALLMAVSMFLYSKITMGNQSTNPNDPTAASMKFMSLYMMPIMMFFICNSLSSGLSYYYLLSNLITMLETWIIKKWFVHPEEIQAKLKASAGKPVPKSKWAQRIEEAQKMQQQQLKMQQQQQRQGGKKR